MTKLELVINTVLAILLLRAKKEKCDATSNDPDPQLKIFQYEMTKSKSSCFSLSY